MSKYYGKFPLGKIFGRWVVTNPNVEYNEKSQAKVNVQCECGTYKQVFATHLLNGKSTSCGCGLAARTGSNNPNYRGDGSVSGMTVRALNVANNTTFVASDLSNLASSQSYQCQWSGLPLSGNLVNATITTSGYDSGTSSLTYYWVNHDTQHYAWAHKDIFKMKGNFDDDYFIELCHRVAERHPRPNPVIATAKEIAQKINVQAKKSNPIIDAANEVAKKYK